MAAVTAVPSPQHFPIIPGKKGSDVVNADTSSKLLLPKFAVNYSQTAGFEL